ncbi:MAG: hypothetical protein ABL878_15940, partial [Burkholderiales bacterium]
VHSLCSDAETDESDLATDDCMSHRVMRQTRNKGWSSPETGVGAPKSGAQHVLRRLAITDHPSRLRHSLSQALATRFTLL